MKFRTTAALTLLAAGCLALPLRADVLQLHDGRVLVGKVVVKEDANGKTYEVTTRDGVVRVAEREVARHQKDPELRRELALLEAKVAKTPFSHLQLAAQARAWGLDAELWRHLDAAVAVPRDGENGALRGRVDDFLAQLEPELLPRKYRKAPTRTRVHELLAKVRRDAGAAKTQAVQELLVREPNAEEDLRAHARRNGEPARRLTALEALLRRGTPGSDRFAWRTSILDGNEHVRAESVRIAKAHGAPTEGVVAYLAPGLMHGNGEVRIRTAEALANVGDLAAVKLLVMAGPNAGKALAGADGSVRAHVAFMEQQAYIRDFDVEVAQAAFIADPKVDVLHSGTVLDVTVHGVLEEVRIVNAYRSALQRLAGSDPGARPRDWATWLAGVAEQKPLPASPPAVTPGAAKG